MSVAGKVTPAVARLLACADAALDIAKECREAGDNAKALECTLVAAEYVRAAKAMQAMNDASALYEAKKALLP